MNRSDFFNKANEITNKDRAATHGAAENSFQSIADYWNVYLKHRGFLDKGSSGLDPLAIAVMMSLFKVARSDANPGHEDNWLDLVGYSGIAGEIAGNNKALADKRFFDDTKNVTARERVTGAFAGEVLNNERLAKFNAEAAAMKAKEEAAARETKHASEAIADKMLSEVANMLDELGVTVLIGKLTQEQAEEDNERKSADDGTGQCNCIRCTLNRSLSGVGAAKEKKDTPKS